MGAFYPFKPCRTCTGEVSSSPALLSAEPVTAKEDGTRDIFPVDAGALPSAGETPEEADPTKLLPEPKGPTPLPPPSAGDSSFLTSPVGAVVSVGAVAAFIGYLMSNMGTTRGNPRFS